MIDCRAFFPSLPLGKNRAEGEREKAGVTSEMVDDPLEREREGEGKRKVGSVVKRV